MVGEPDAEAVDDAHQPGGHARLVAVRRAGHAPAVQAIPGCPHGRMVERKSCAPCPSSPRCGAPCVSNPLAKKRPAARPMRDRYFGPGPLSSSPAAADSRAASGSKYLQLHAASGVVKRSRFARTGHSGVPASPPCLRTSHGTAPYTTTDRCPTRPYLPQVLCSASGVTPRRAHRRVRLRPWAAPERRLGRAKWGRVSRLR
jgi:hypothetical protein